MEEYPVTLPAAWRPSHPGALLREDVLPALDISKTDFAAALGLSRQMLYDILEERSAVTPATALRLGKLLGNGPRIWLAMQQEHDLWQAERELAGTIEQIRTLAAH